MNGSDDVEIRRREQENQSKLLDDLTRAKRLIERCEDLASSPWNVDDTILRDNMKRIQGLISLYRARQ